MSSNYLADVPDFKSTQDAVDYGEKIKYEDRIIARLKEKHKELWEDAYSLEFGWMLMGQKGEGNIYRDQFVRIGIVMDILERRKKRGDVGSSFVASSEPI